MVMGLLISLHTSVLVVVVVVVVVVDLRHLEHSR